MGSMSADPSQEEQPVTVLITGFGPFKKDYPVNPSWEIARSLPEWLPPLRAKTVATTATVAAGSPSALGRTAAAAAPPPIPPVRIRVHPEPIRVSYRVVRDLVPKLWDGDGDGRNDNSADIVIHVGMAGPRLFYSVERRGHRDGYAMRDVDGELLRDDEERERERGRGRGRREEKGEGGDEGGNEGEGENRGTGGGWVWEGLPAELLTDFDLDDVLARWRGYCPQHMDLRISEDAGHYLCDFIYFSSLAHLYKAGRRRKVLFLHVPSDASEHGIAIGREILLQLVRSVVESELARGRKLRASEEASS